MDKITFTTAGVEREAKTYYRNCWTIGLGSEYRIGDNLTIRAGIKFDQSATRDTGLNPATVDVDLITPSINIAYDMTKSAEMNIAVIRAFGLEEKIHSTKYDKAFLSFLVGIRLKY